MLLNCGVGEDRLKGFMRMGNKEIEAVVTYQFSKMLTLGPLHWEHRVLATGPSGKSLL